MTTNPVEEHPVLSCAERIAAALDSVEAVNPTFMRADAKAAALTALRREKARLEELELRVVAASSDVAEAAAVKDIGIWLANETLADHAAAHADMRLAESLDRRWQHLAAGMREGVVSLAQARVIARALDRVVDEALPRVDDLTLEQRTELAQRAEATLVSEATRLRPKELRTVGKRILEMVAPELFADAEAARIAEEEDHAWRRTSLRMQEVGDGTTKVFLRLPDAAAARLRTYLEAFTAPRHGHTPAGRAGFGVQGEGDRIPGDRKLGQAFCALLEHLDPARLPAHGGDATTLVVTIDLPDLLTCLGTAELLDGTQLSAGEARRLACTARILPAVLGGASEVLDLGQADRIFRPPQRKAIRVRDQHCRADGCAVRAEWCEVHHLTPWRDGGPTNLDNGILLCHWHHRRVEDPRYDTDFDPATRILTITRRRRAA